MCTNLQIGIHVVFYSNVNMSNPVQKIVTTSWRGLSVTFEHLAKLQETSVVEALTQSCL